VLFCFVESRVAIETTDGEIRISWFKKLFALAFLAFGSLIFNQTGNLRVNANAPTDIQSFVRNS
jgi:hypothetical protein